MLYKEGTHDPGIHSAWNLSGAYCKAAVSHLGPDHNRCPKMIPVFDAGAF